MSQSKLTGIGMISKHKGPCEFCKKEFNFNLECMTCHLAGFEGEGSTYYCSQDHLEQDWAQHQTKCVEVYQKRRRIRDVDLLEKVIDENKLPHENNPCYETFGFSQCADPQEQSHLLSLYKGLFWHLEVDREKVREAAGNGTLAIAQFISEQYEVRSPGRRGWYYEWFQENKARLFPGNQ